MIVRAQAAVVLVVVVCLLAGCGPQTEVASDGPVAVFTSTIDEFVIEAGAQVRIAANQRITVRQNAIISGELVVDAAAGGDFTVIAETGDLVVEGTIRVDETSRAAQRHANQNRPLPNGATIILEARTGDIVMKKTTLLQSGRGYDAPPEAFSGPGELHVAQNGTDGGSIILQAPLGAIRLPAGRRIGDPEPFGIGSGGNGADVTVAASYLPGTDLVEVRAGHGGASGSLILDAPQVTGTPTLNELGDLARPGLIERGIDRATGGEGGSVTWGLTSADGRASVTEIQLHAGDGGDGILNGGAGGSALYQSDTVINDAGQPAASAFCYGGRGGDVFEAPVPVRLASGGDGGDVGVVGNNGQHGTATFDGAISDGARGGRALGQGGDGGDVLAGVRAVESSGGDGGGTLDVGVQAGVGGNGLSRCNCRGGHGGDSGDAAAIGGRGGSMLGTAFAAPGAGAGGDVLVIVHEEQSFGGDGSPPGDGGCIGEAVATVGPDGAGMTVGSGQDFSQEVDPDLACGEAGAECGEETSCEEEQERPDDESPETGVCEAGDQFTVRKDTLEPGVTRTSSTILIGTGEYQGQGLGWIVLDGTFTRLVTSNGEVSTESREATPTEISSAVSVASNPDCSSGSLQWADTGSIILELGFGSTVTYSLSGCNPFGFSFEVRDEYSCVPVGDGWIVHGPL